MAVDKQKIIAGVSQLQVLGNRDGLIPVFNVYLTNGPATMYNTICYEFERRMGKQHLEETRDILINCAWVCGYNTFNGIQTSKEWDGLIAPMVKTPEDKIIASAAVCNALGWVNWDVSSLNSNGATFVATKGYEAELYRKEYGLADHPVCYMLCGVVSSLMDLSYGEPFPDGLYSYETVETKCRAKGDSCCEFQAKKIFR